MICPKPRFLMSAANSREDFIFHYPRSLIMGNITYRKWLCNDLEIKRFYTLFLRYFYPLLTQIRGQPRNLQKCRLWLVKPPSKSFASIDPLGAVDNCS